MGDEMGDLSVKYYRLLRRVIVLEDIAERMASTCEDPVAVAELRQWQAGSTNV
jgi:hypothetical protein